MKLLEKLRHQMRTEPSPNPQGEPSLKELLLGAVMVVVVVFIGYAWGRSDGIKFEIEQIPQLKSVAAKIDKLESELLGSRVTCQEAAQQPAKGE